MKKLFNPHQQQLGVDSKLGFRGVLAGGDGGGFSPGRSTGRGAVSAFKIPKVGVLATPKRHYGNVPLARMRPVSGPLAAVQGLKGSLFSQLPGTSGGLAKNPRGKVFR